MFIIYNVAEPKAIEWNFIVVDVSVCELARKRSSGLQCAARKRATLERRNWLFSTVLYSQ